MAQYAPKTWTTGETITAAELNAIEQAAAAAAVKTDADAAYDTKGAATTAQAAAISAAATDATTKANAAQAVAVQRANHTGTQSADTLTDGTTNKAFLATERTKLTGIASGATANSTDVQLRDRSTHTGTQAAATVTGLATVATSGSYADLSSKPTIPAAPSDATTGAKGLVQLAGDLAGTAAAPSVPKLANHESRITVLEGAASVAGVEIGSAQLTTSYSISGQAGTATFTDIGLSIAVPAQTRAYNIALSCTVGASTDATFTTAPKFLAVLLRIVDSAVTAVADVSQFPMILPVTGAQALVAKAYLLARIPAGQAATTWKVQARQTPGNITGVTAVTIQAGTALSAPAGGVSFTPIQLQAITV